MDECPRRLNTIGSVRVPEENEADIAYVLHHIYRSEKAEGGIHRRELLKKFSNRMGAKTALAFLVEKRLAFEDERGFVAIHPKKRERIRKYLYGVWPKH